MSDFHPAYRKLVLIEGYYLSDSDGDTYCGICRKYWPKERIWGYVDREKPLKNGERLKNRRADSIVEVFYYTNFWKDTKLPLIENQKVATFIFCQSVNNPTEAVKVAQEVVRVDNDGIFGPKTLEAINSYEGPIVEEMRQMWETYYRIIGGSNLKGWLNRLKKIS